MLTLQLKINNAIKTMKKVLFIMLSAVMTATSVSADRLDSLVQPGKFAPLPRVSSTFWRDSVPEAMRRSYIEYGEQYLGKPWVSMPATLFAEFKTNGNRTRYEAVNFEKRRQLAALAMAEVVEGKGRFTGDVVNGLCSLCEETWWGLPAHYGTKIPLVSDQNVDLFNAETAGMIAWIRYVLAPQLDAFSPDVCRRIDSEIIRRVLRPALAHDYWWKKAGMNWNPWICSNWLTCILVCENDREQQLAGVRQVMDAMDAFVNAYPADGGCDEGTGYWDRAAASLFECMRLLDIATGTNRELLTPKVRAMMDYIYKMYIGNGYCVNFADAHDNRMQAQPDIVLPIALYLDDPDMKGFAAHIARENHLYDNPAALYAVSGNFPAIGRELFMLRDIAAAGRLVAKEPQTRDVWLADLQIMTARRGDFYVAMKGGNNGESHNHNDVGNFIVYASGEPLIIDVGVGEYTSATFGNDRYSIWTMQSAFHNLPLINGTTQKEGKEYAARMVGRKAGSLSLDIAGAYPEQAAVKSWVRTVKAKDSAIEVTEDYVLDACNAPTQIMLLTTVNPVVDRAGRIAIGAHRVEYDARQLEASVEDISDKLDQLLQGVWGKQLYRIVLTVKSDGVKGRIAYRVL